MQNSKETWLQIGEIFNLGKRKTHGAETVSTEQFYKYFKQQNATPLNNILDPETNMETHSNDEEIEAAINKLKANKSPGFDNILNEVIKSDFSKFISSNLRYWQIPCSLEFWPHCTYSQKG